MEFLGKASHKYFVIWILPVKIQKEGENSQLSLVLLIRNILFGGLKRSSVFLLICVVFRRCYELSRHLRKDVP